MTGFLESAACRGRKPEHIITRRFFSRPDLIAKLLRERHVARFVVAPDGFGKSTLVYEYADTVFSFNHVFWINGRSPCFLRDLDQENIAERLCSMDSSPFLVVFEDVPRLDAVRVDRFSQVIDDLLEAGEEVMVTCTPSCDAYAERHRDRTKLDASDLLLSESECAYDFVSKSHRQSIDEAIPRSERIACLRWGTDGQETLLAGVAREELPGEVMVAMFVLFTLCEGGWADLQAFVSLDAEGDVVELLAEGYPFFGLDRHMESYHAVELPMPKVALAFEHSFDVLAGSSLFEDRDVLTQRLADALVARFLGERACLLMSSMASKTTCASWLASRGRSLTKIACLKPAHDLFLYIGRARKVQRIELNVGEAWRLVLLGDKTTALATVRRSAYAPEVSEGTRALALLVVMMHGSRDARVRARAEIQALVQAGDATKRSGADSSTGAAAQLSQLSCEPSFWLPIAKVALALDEGLESGLRLWCEAERDGIDSDVLAIAAALALKAATETEKVYLPTNLVEHIAQFVSVRFDAALFTPDLFLALAGLAFEQICSSNVKLQALSLSLQAVTKIQSVETSLISQREAYSRNTKEREEQKRNFNSTHPDVYRNERRTSRKALTPQVIVPTLRVNLFGGLDVRIGDNPVDPKKLCRQKTRTLLALLVLNHGKEMPRDRLVRALWPESNMEAARKNFYSIWSQLRRAIALPSGMCPYLIRAQSSCRIDASLLDSDVAQFETLCRALLFGRPESEEWETLLAQVSAWYADDILPGETECELIVQTRDEFRIHLVDALVAASTRLMNAGEVRGGLWFAREAMKRDRSREDVYSALMEAQIAAGQRSAALETYFACRKYLAEELGIDPSLRTVRLYRDIIEAEETLEW